MCPNPRNRNPIPGRRPARRREPTPITSAKPRGPTAPGRDWSADEVAETRFTFKTLPAYLRLHDGIPMKCRDGRWGLMDPEQVRRGTFRLKIQGTPSGKGPFGRRTYRGVDDLIADGWVVS